MLFSDHPRTHYRNAPAHEVICQLRFPSILTINSVEPPIFRRPSARSSPSMPGARTPRRPASPGWAAPIPRWSSSLR